MAEEILVKEEITAVSYAVLLYCYGNESSINGDMINRVAGIIEETLNKIMEHRNKQPDEFLINEDELRKIFEEQHKNRNLQKHRLRGTYQSAPIAALWNQHIKTARLIEKLLVDRLKERQQP